MANVLILGRSGQLARALRALAWPAGWQVDALGRQRLGAAEQTAQAATAAIESRRPHLVLNAAAYAAVDRAESEPDLARILNADLPLAVAAACAGLRIPLVHVSTDYVFDGAKTGPYVETDTPNPLGVYGATKLSGDRNVEGAGTVPGRPRRWAILRASWVFSAADDAFPAKILRQAREGKTLRVVDDQVGCPTPAAALAGAMQAMGLRLLDNDADAQGLFNYCGAQAMSWHGFAAKLLDAAVRAGLERRVLEPVASDRFPTAARRPRNSILDCAKIERQCDLAPAAVDDEIDRVAYAILAR